MDSDDTTSPRERSDGLSFDMASVHAAKKELRRLMRKKVSSISTDTLRDQSLHVFKTLTALPEYLAAKRISVFLSMPTGEISTTPIVRDALARGKTVFIPYLHKDSEQVYGPPSVMDMLRLQSTQEYEGLKLDKWGIPTLEDNSIRGRENSLGGKGIEEGRDVNGEIGLDLILMPGMAFDRNIGRLGHGKGYYDFFLYRYQEAVQAQDAKRELQKVNPFLVGLALNEQLLPASENVPTDPTDWRLDGIILGDGTILHKKTL